MKHGTAFSVSISVLLVVDFQIGNLTFEVTCFL